MGNRIYTTIGANSGVTYVKAHLRKGKPVRAYSRGNHSRSHTSPYADKNIYGKVNKLLTPDGSLIRTTGKHKGLSFKADILFDSKTGVGQFDASFYKAKNTYKKFKGDADKYIRKKSKEFDLKRGDYTAKRAKVNQDIAYYFEKNKRKYTR